MEGVRLVLSIILATARDPRQNSTNDPVVRVKASLLSDPERLKEIDNRIEGEISAILAGAMREVAP